MLRLTVLIIILTTTVLAQRPHIGKVPSEIQEQCKSQVQITDGELEILEEKSKRCVDAFESSESGRCYHLCLLEKMGYSMVLDIKNMARLQNKWKFLVEKRFLTMVNYCLKIAANKDTGGTCEKPYHFYKCFEKAAGNYPTGTKHVAIDFYNPQFEGKCTEKSGIAGEDLCKALSAKDNDGFEEDIKSKCYHVCHLEEVGFFKGTTMNYPLIEKRFDYVEKGVMKKIYDGCYKPFDEAAACEAVYALNKCIMTTVGEYPVPVEKLDL